MVASDLLKSLRTHIAYLADGKQNIDDVKSVIQLTYIAVTWTSNINILVGHEKRSLIIEGMQEICTSDMIDLLIPHIVDLIVQVKNEKLILRGCCGVRKSRTNC